MYNPKGSLRSIASCIVERKCIFFTRGVVTKGVAKKTAGASRRCIVVKRAEGRAEKNANGVDKKHDEQAKRTDVTGDWVPLKRWAIPSARFTSVGGRGYIGTIKDASEADHDERYERWDCESSEFAFFYLLAKTLFASAILCVSSLLRTAFPMFLEASVSSLVNFETVSRPDRFRQAARIQRIARAVPR